jgi:hypothetical protein
MSITKRPLVLTILDGWGYSPKDREQRHRPRPQAHLRQAPRGIPQHPHPRLRSLRRPARRPDGQQRSRPLNIGAGRVVQMDITRIDLLIANDEFTNFPAIAKAMQRPAKTAAACISSACSPTAASTPTRSTSTPCCAPPRPTASPASSSTPSWMAATRCPPTAQATSRSYSRSSRIRHRQTGQRQRPLLRHGSRQEVGPRTQGLQRHVPRQSRRRQPPATPSRS